MGGETVMKEMKSKKMKWGISLALFMILALAALSAGCTSDNPAASQKNPVMQQKNAFIAAANNCTTINAVITDEVGTFQYTSSDSCTFTKTLVRLNESEMQEMKTMLEGKSMTCNYTRGSFDPRLVTSLIGGIEHCSGDLKDDITNMMLFT
jgi:hypothetical protein